MRDEYSKPLGLLLAIAGCVLLIACANLANLMLARASARQREIAVRLALGASRARVAGSCCPRGSYLRYAARALGLLLARGLSRFLVSFLASGGDTTFVALPDDFRVFAFAAGLAVLTCLVFAVAPAWRATRTDAADVLKSGGRLTAGRERLGMRRALVVSQIAVSLALLAGTMLFVRSLRNLQALDAGFDRRGMLMADVGFGPPGMASGRVASMRREVFERLRAIPGVSGVAEAAIVPLTGRIWNNRMWMDGSDASKARVSMRSMVGAQYFRTLKTPLLAGREFEDRDMGTTAKLAVVNEEFARQFTGGTNPVGRRFWIETTPTVPQASYEIIGLTRNAKYSDLREPFQPEMFIPMTREALESAGGRFLIRSGAGMDATAAAVRDRLTGSTARCAIRCACSIPGWMNRCCVNG